MDLIPTPSQTVGPYFHLGLTSKNSIACITKARTSEESVWLTCCVFDGDGVPVNDAMIEMWQADGAGEYPRAEDLGGSANEPAFQGFGRLASDENGICTFETTKPGRVPGP